MTEVLEIGGVFDGPYGLGDVDYRSTFDTSDPESSFHISFLSYQHGDFVSASKHKGAVIILHVDAGATTTPVCDAYFDGDFAELPLAIEWLWNMWLAKRAKP